MTTGAEAKDFATLKPTGFEPKIHSIFDFTDEALQEHRLWLEMHPPSVPIQQVLGFSQFTVQTSTVPDIDTTTSTSFTDLAHDGPVLSGLPDGKYLVLFGAALLSSNTNDSIVSLSVNGAAAADVDGINIANLAGVTLALSRASTVVLEASGNNSIRLKYRKHISGTATFGNRWLIALKYDNP